MTPFYHGTRAALGPGDRIEPLPPSGAEGDAGAAWVCLTPDLDGALWASELAPGDGPARVYIVEPTGPIEEAPDPDDGSPPGHPRMTWRSREPLRVVEELEAWPLYHGTRARLEPGDLVQPGHNSNYGSRKNASHVYLTATLDAAAWGAELARGEGPGRIYLVEPTGPIEDDPNLTNAKFRGNPTKSYRSRQPLRVLGELTGWKGHAPEAIEAMKEGLRRLERMGIEAVED
jgi:hypothetical protein